MDSSSIDLSHTLIVAFFVSLIIVAFLRFLRSHLRRQSARYALYAVRDELIAHVAKGRLRESDRVFSYYYTRINNSLESIPVYGFDNALLTYIEYKDKTDFDRKLADERRNAQEILDAAASLDPGVLNTIASFYSANRQMLLAHSSSIRILYILTSRQLVPFLQLKVAGFLGRLIGERLRMALEFLLFADGEVNDFRELATSPSSSRKSSIRVC